MARNSRRSSSPVSLGSRSGWTTRPSSSMTRMTSSFIGPADREPYNRPTHGRQASPRPTGTPNPTTETETPMRINPKDVVSFAGRDYIVEGTATYHLGGKTFALARAVDGEIVCWIGAARDEADDRLLVLREIRDLEIAVPPPESINYHDLMYVQRLSGRATIEIAGRVPERSAGSADVWRY